MSTRPPQPGELTVALDALEADAALWSRAAADLHAAAATLDGQQLDPTAFSFAGDAVAATYEALRVKAAALVHAGADNLDAIAAALRTSAATYAAEDAAGMHRLSEFS
ncbi:MAG: Excreted virulence factor EspC, type diderm [Pseudonocardia sp.]|jgi:hypothetical protein|nr:Excreted virulence factor EspC, type diderm [Pseudonocardia sp.]